MPLFDLVLGIGVGVYMGIIAKLNWGILVILGSSFLNWGWGPIWLDSPCNFEFWVC